MECRTLALEWHREPLGFHACSPGTHWSCSLRAPPLLRLPQLPCSVHTPMNAPEDDDTECFSRRKLLNGRNGPGQARWGGRIVVMGHLLLGTLVTLAPPGCLCFSVWQLHEAGSKVLGTFIGSTPRGGGSKGLLMGWRYSLARTHRTDSSLSQAAGCSRKVACKGIM